MASFVVTAAEAGRRLDVVLAARAGLPRAAARRAVEQGAVTVDGRPATKPARALAAGARVAYRIPPTGASELVPEDVPVPVVYEDDWLLVVDKPAGMVVHPAPGHDHGTLVHGLLARGIAGGHRHRPGVVHRLDKDTSGLLIVARTPEAHRRLVESMAARRIARHYVALLEGDFPQDESVIDAPIGRHLRDRTRMSLLSASPRRAVTHVRVRERLPGFTLCDVRLETGRTHQIRVHAAALGYPVAGDVAYGRRRRPPGLKRQFLHAARLAFPHPADGRPCDFEAPLPADLTAFLQSLRESGATRHRT